MTKAGFFGKKTCNFVQMVVCYSDVLFCPSFPSEAEKASFYEKQKADERERERPGRADAPSTEVRKTSSRNPPETQGKDFGAMSEELQSLLEKINSDGIMKANAERDAIIAKAKSEAAAIVAAAKKEAADLRTQAAAEAETLQKRAESAISQAARDVVLKLKAELGARISAAVEGAAEEAMTPEFMAELIKALGAQFLSAPEAELTVITAVRDAAKLDAALKGALAASLRKQPRVLAEPTIKGGMEVNFSGSELFFDFSTEALTELLAAYTAPRIAAIFAGDK